MIELAQPWKKNPLLAQHVLEHLRAQEAHDIVEFVKLGQSATMNADDLSEQPRDVLEQVARMGMVGSNDLVAQFRDGHARAIARGDRLRRDSFGGCNHLADADASVATCLRERVLPVTAIVEEKAVEVSVVERDLSAEARKIGKSGAIESATVLADDRGRAP